MFLVGVFCGIHRGRDPPCVLHFKNFRNGEYKMSKCIKIRIKDFYKDAVGETEYTYVTEEVYEALANTFRKETHAEEMRDLRHITVNGYVEGMTEDLIKETGISLEDMVIRQIEIEILQKAMQSLTEVQKERLHLYFFKGMTTREIADKLGVSQNVVWKSIRGSINTLKKFFE